MVAKSDKWPAFNVERRAVGALKPYKNNARTHSEEQVAQIAESIREWGWTQPVLVDEKDGVIAGHGRLMAAQSLGIAEIPVIVARGWSKDQKRAYVLADNQLALNAGWDQDLLRVEIGALGDAFDKSLLGFGDEFLADLFADKTGGLTDPDEAPAAPAVPVSRNGDLWLCGSHRLLCGNSLLLDDVRRLLNGTVPDLANCDPPYGISIVRGAAVGGAKPFGSVRGGGRAGKTLQGRVHGYARNAIIPPNTYAPIIGDESTDTAHAAFAILTEIGVKAIVLWGGNYYADRLPASRCWLVWDKENTGTFADAELAWTNQDAVVRLFRHQWSGLIKASERGEKRVHPTQKPVALAEWVIDAVAPQAKTMIDLFLGIGSALIAAERKAVTCFGMEMAPPYCDVIVKRWQAFTGRAATLESDGRTFDEVRHEREEGSIQEASQEASKEAAE